MGTDPARVSTGWREQEFLSSVPGFLSFVVHEVLNAEEQCDNTHKVFCDLLAELIKFVRPFEQQLVAQRGAYDEQMADLQARVADAIAAVDGATKEQKELEKLLRSGGDKSRACQIM